MSNNRDLLMISLARFFNNKHHMGRLLPVVEGRSEVSLRMVDWFVTTYAKSTGVVINRRHGNNVVHFSVYLSYRSQLKAFSKKMFDPFRRCDRIKFVYDKGGKTIETTIGQLNFFRWVLENDILEYIQAHYADLASKVGTAAAPATTSTARPRSVAGKAASSSKSASAAANKAAPGGGAVRHFTGAHLVQFT